MVTATARVDLRLSDFQPRSCLTLEEHTVLTPRYPAIDYHNHLDSTDPHEVLGIMDRCGVEHVMQVLIDRMDGLERSRSQRLCRHHH
jgi:hypothetical protein